MLCAVMVFDVMVIGSTKAVIRRQRPAENIEDMMTVSVDKYSFPSGHASRAFMFVTFLFMHFHVSVLWKYTVLLWAVTVAISRVLLGRHHVSDVIIGSLLGCIECSVVNCCDLWLSPDLCAFIIRPIQEELHLGWPPVLECPGLSLNGELSRFPDRIIAGQLCVLQWRSYTG